MPGPRGSASTFASSFSRVVTTPPSSRSPTRAIPGSPDDLVTPSPELQVLELELLHAVAQLGGLLELELLGGLEHLLAQRRDLAAELLAVLARAHAHRRRRVEDRVLLLLGEVEDRAEVLLHRLRRDAVLLVVRRLDLA